jgi:hypothetical protein
MRLPSILFGTWARINSAVRMSPAMAAGLTDTLLSMTDIAEMVEASLPKPGPRGPYKTRRPAKFELRSAGSWGGGIFLLARGAAVSARTISTNP